MVESSGALILKDVRTGDDGVYSCRAENLLGSINASAKLTVQCKLHYLIYESVINRPNAHKFLILFPTVAIYIQP